MDEIILNAMSDQIDERDDWLETQTEEKSLDHEIEVKQFLENNIKPPERVPDWFLNGEWDLEPITCCLCDEILGTKRSGSKCFACDVDVPYGVTHFCRECQVKWCDNCGKNFDCRKGKDKSGKPTKHKCMPNKQSDCCGSCLKPGCTRCNAKSEWNECVDCGKQTCDKCLYGAGCCGIGTPIQLGCGFWMHHRCKPCFDKNPRGHCDKFNAAISSALERCGWQKFE